MTNKTPENLNPVIEFFDRPGPNRIRTADIHRAIDRLGEEGSEEAQHEVDSGVSFFAHEAGAFVSYILMNTPEGQREEEAVRMIEHVVEAADEIVLGPEHPQGIISGHPDVHALVDEIVPEEGITRDLVQRPSWHSRMRELIGSVVETEIVTHRTAFN